MGSLADSLKAALAQGGAPAAAAGTPPPPAAQVAQQPQAQSAAVQTASSPAPTLAPLTTAQSAIPGNLYMLLLADGTGGMHKFEGAVPSGAFFTSAAGLPKLIAFGEAVRDMTADPVTRALFKLPPLPGSEPAPEAPKRRMLIVDEPITQAAAPSIVSPDMPAHSPAANAAPASTQAAPATATSAAPPADAVPNVPPATEEKPKKPRGRPRKQQNADGSNIVANALDADADGGPLVLLVNCTAAGAFDLSPYVLEVAQKIAAAAKLPDVRLAPSEHNLAFGRWKAVIAGAVLADPPVGLCSIRSGDLSDPIIEALSGVASLVVR